MLSNHSFLNILPSLVVTTGRSKIAFYLFQLSVLSSRAWSLIQDSNP